MEPQGIYSFLATTHLVVLLAAFLAITLVPIQLMRNHFEGCQYDVAWSANLGGMLQVLVYIIGIGIIQKGQSLLSWPGIPLQVVMGVISLLIGIVWLKNDWHTQWADRYHHIVVVPIQFFLLFAIVPEIVIRGTVAEVAMTICFFVSFIFLFVVDSWQGRLAQRLCLIRRLGAKFKNETNAEEDARVEFHIQSRMR